jgi:acetyl esterase/lipase
VCEEYWKLLQAGFFLSLYGRTWPPERGAQRTILRILPLLLVLGLLIWMGLKSVSIVVFFLVPGVLFTSLQDFFLPVTGLLIVFLLLRLVIRPLRIRTPGAVRTTFILLPALLLINLITWGGSVSASDTAWLSTSTPVSILAGQTRTLTYCNTSNGTPLAMDISEPAAQTARSAPMVFYIHGGETLVGSRVLEDESLQGMYLVQLRTNLLNRGFVVGSIDYGLVPLYNVGEQVREAKCAVRFLRAHANQLGIDPQRIGVYGDSQGGYISSMLGTVGPDASYDVGQYLNQSSHVQAVVDMWGPTDLSNFSGSPSWASLLVGRGTTAQLRNASPLYYVAHGDPPFLIMHGTDDWFIAPHHSQDMAKKLQAAGVPVTLVMIQHDGHGLAAPTAGQVEQPSPDALVQMIANFFSKTLAS